MVVAMRGLTGLSPLGATPMGLQERQGASLALPSSAEPLNATADAKPVSPSPVGFGEGKSNPGFRPGEPNRQVLNARREDLKTLTRTASRTQLLSPLKQGSFLG